MITHARGWGKKQQQQNRTCIFWEVALILNRLPFTRRRDSRWLGSQIFGEAGPGRILFRGLDDERTSSSATVRYHLDSSPFDLDQKKYCGKNYWNESINRSCLILAEPFVVDDLQSIFMCIDQIEYRQFMEVDQTHFEKIKKINGYHHLISDFYYICYPIFKYWCVQYPRPSILIPPEV